MQVGVIGTGALGRHYDRLYSACPQADLVGVLHVNRESACDEADGHGQAIELAEHILAAARDGK